MNNLPPGVTDEMISDQFNKDLECFCEWIDGWIPDHPKMQSLEAFKQIWLVGCAVIMDTAAQAEELIEDKTAIMKEAIKFQKESIRLLKERRFGYEQN